MKNCRLCRMDIVDSADVCNHCRSYQKPWRQFIVLFGAPLVTLLVALPAIVAVSIPYVRTAIYGHRDDVAITLVHVDEGEQRIILSVSNTGDGNAMLRSAEVILPASVAARKAAPGWSLNLPNDRVLQAKQHRQLDVWSKVGKIPGLADQHQPFVKYAIRVVTVRSDGSLKEFNLSYRARQPQ